MAKFIQTAGRKHKLSFIPGGHTLVITDIFGEAKIYDKVHYTLAYITEVLLNDKNIYSITIDDQMFWHRDRGGFNINTTKPARRLVPLTRMAA